MALGSLWHMLTLKTLLNQARNIILFRIRYPWVEIGKEVHCKLSARFWSQNKRIILGDRVGIGYDCLFQCDIRIGNDVLIGAYSGFVNSDDHIYNVVGKTIWESGRGDTGEIVIEEDVWIGYGVTVLTPARIGRGSVVAAGSVVVADVPPYSIVGGVPARVLKMRFTPEQIEVHDTMRRSTRHC
jgi:acetyltransferase-like isoleucine patch superfamily enzyme